MCGGRAVNVEIKQILQRSDPFSTKKCNGEKCVICTEKVGVGCRTRGCVYQITCKECKDKPNTENKVPNRTHTHTHTLLGEFESDAGFEFLDIFFP